jgi:hypothetical protein
MNTRQRIPTTVTTLLTPVRSGLLQRKCACGGTPGPAGECQECRKKTLQRKTRSSELVPRNDSSVPPIVHEVLRSPGQPLDPAARAFFEPRFGYDFSHVRVHTDQRADQSARAVNALAYTVDRNIVFGSHQYATGTDAGRKLLAHELSHVVQQRGSNGAPTGVEAPDTVPEREANAVASRILSGRRAPALSAASPAIMRSLKVDNASQPIPTPSADGQTPSNAEAMEQYLRTMAPNGNVAVDRASGDVTMDPELCRHRGFFGRLGHGIASGFMTGGRIGAYVFGVGAIPGAILGGIIGGIAGIFGADSQAEESSTPTGSTCLCDHVNGPHLWTIEVNDQDHPATMGGRRVRVTSPNSPTLWGAAMASGRLENYEPWLLLAHELCGHAWLEEHRSPGEDDDEGVVQGQDARHHRSVERENAIRKEHGMEARGYRLKEPYCGESFSRDRSAPQAAPHWPGPYDESQRAHLLSQGNTAEANRTDLSECQRMREEAFGERARRYRVDQAIPE